MATTIKRPRVLTLICLIGYAWSFMNLIYVFSPFLKQQSIWLPAFYGLTIALRFISYVGVSHMKKWGVHLFILDFSAGVTILVFYGIEINFISVSLGIISVITFLPYYRRMDENL